MHDLFAYRASLDRPVIGVEAELSLIADGQETEPESIWRHPSELVGGSLLPRTSRSLQLPTGGVLYFDRGVIEVVTPLIEIAPRCTSRAVRSLWEQIDFAAAALRRWSTDHGRAARLRAFSCHYNVSFEISREHRGAARNIQKLALLLAHLLPIPVMFFGLNRRSTGVGVRPRRDRLEVTLDFTPDPALMLVTAAVIVGITRDVISWPAYTIELLERIGLPLPADVHPGRHATRKGWLTRDYHFPYSPFTTGVDQPVWPTRSGETMSLRQIATSVAHFFRRSIRWHSDAFTYRLLISMLSGRTRSLLELPDRPSGYDDIGGVVRWGHVLPELANFETEGLSGAREWDLAGLEAHITSRETARARHLAGVSDEQYEKKEEEDDSMETSEPLPDGHRRASDVFARLGPPWSAAESDRRMWRESKQGRERRRNDRRKSPPPVYPSTTLDRSAYETVFINLGMRRTLLIEGERWNPVGMDGWYQTVLRRESDGEERRIAVEQLVNDPGLWIA